MQIAGERRKAEIQRQTSLGVVSFESFSKQRNPVPPEPEEPEECAGVRESKNKAIFIQNEKFHQFVYVFAKFDDGEEKLRTPEKLKERP